MSCGIIRGMIAYIRGMLEEKDPTRVVIEAAGVGYEILIPLSTYDRLPRVGGEAKLLVSHCVREDDEILFGFATESEKDLFSKLTCVSGVGPKIAIAILSGSTAGDLALAIASGDVKRLSAIKGVGKKTAEKICLELRDKVNAFAAQAEAKGANREQMAVLRDAVLALGALGFNEETSSKMVADVLAANPGIADTESIIRKALTGGKK